MKAIVSDQYGPPVEVLRLADRPIPDPGEDGILVRVHAAGLNPADWHMTTGIPRLARVQLGLRRPKAVGLGIDLAGRVESVGPSVTRFTPGDLVWGMVGHVPGSSVPDLGSVAEYVRVAEDAIRHVPGPISVLDAAALGVAATTALRGIRDIAEIQPGQHVLINGASGGVGTFAVQVAKALGAEVTGVCSTGNVDLVRSLGADHVIDYTRDDPTRTTGAVDVVLDNVGNRPLRRWLHVLDAEGTYVANFGQKEHRVLGPFAYLIRMFLARPFAAPRLRMLPSVTRPEELDTLVELMEAGRLRTVIDRTYALADAPEALAYVGQGHARGKVVVTIAEGR